MPAPVSIPRAFAVACLGIATFSAMDVTMKLLALQSGVFCALLWRSTIGVAIAGVIHFGRRPSPPGRPALRLHVERGLVVTAMAYLFFWGLARVPMAQAIALCFIAPLLTLVLAAVLLKEKIGGQAMLASGVAFAGVLVVVGGQAREHAGAEAVHGCLAILCAALCYAYNLILMRRQGAHSDAIEVAFYQNAVMAGVLVVLSPWLGGWPLPGQWPVAIAGAMFATLSNILLAWAYGHAPTSRMAPSEYTGFLWASLFGWAVFGETLRVLTVAGAALIIVGCLIAAGERAAKPIEGDL